MPRGDKSSYTDKQKRRAEHIEDSYEDSGVSHREAERRAWATVNKETGGGKKSGSGRGKPENRSASKKGGKLGGRAAARRPAAARSASAKKGAATRKRNAAKKRADGEATRLPCSPVLKERFSILPQAGPSPALLLCAGAACCSQPTIRSPPSPR